jgi:hypothetical protein
MLVAVESNRSDQREVRWLERDSCDWMDLLVVLERRYCRHFGTKMMVLLEEQSLGHHEVQLGENLDDVEVTARDHDCSLDLCRYRARGRATWALKPPLWEVYRLQEQLC